MIIDILCIDFKIWNMRDKYLTNALRRISDLKKKIKKKIKKIKKKK